MEIIKDRSFEGERVLFKSSDLRLENVNFYPGEQLGESALKECRNIEAYNCGFYSKYPFWHDEKVVIERCFFDTTSRAAIWISREVSMMDCVVDAPKMFRRITGLRIENTKLSNAAECCWFCTGIDIRNVEMRMADYVFMNGTDIRIAGLRLQGNYSFQDARNVEVRNSVLDSKDAFWNTENVTVYDSEITGEYLGWYSKNLRLVNCVISGTQPLCYVDNLVMENCVMKGADRSFEDTVLDATVCGDIHSVKNPAGGTLKARSIGEVIRDENCKNPGCCTIQTEL